MIGPIGAGAHFSAVTTFDGFLYTFGYGQSGRLGHGDDRDLAKPKKVAYIPLRPITFFALGDFHSLVVAAGKLYSFGCGSFGQLGHGETTNEFKPRNIKFFTGRYVRTAAGGSCHSLVVTDESAIYSFGQGSLGQLGHGDTANQLSPKKIKFFERQIVTKVSAGNSHSLVLSDGGLYSFGGGNAGQLGHGNKINLTLPKKVAFFDKMDIKTFSAGSFYSLVSADFCLYSFGAGNFGQLGHGSKTDYHYPKKVDFFDGKVVVAIASGFCTSLVATPEALYSFGSGAFGGLGHGDQADQLYPKEVIFFAGKNIISVASGHYYGLAATGDGLVYSFGAGSFGQLGHDDNADIFLPKIIEKFEEHIVAVPPTPFWHCFTEEHFYKEFVEDNKEEENFIRGTVTFVGCLINQHSHRIRTGVDDLLKFVTSYFPD